MKGSKLQTKQLPQTTQANSTAGFHYHKQRSRCGKLEYDIMSALICSAYCCPSVSLSANLYAYLSPLCLSAGMDPLAVSTSIKAASFCLSLCCGSFSLLSGQKEHITYHYDQKKQILSISAQSMKKNDSSCECKYATLSGCCMAISFAVSASANSFTLIPCSTNVAIGISALADIMSLLSSCCLNKFKIDCGRKELESMDIQLELKEGEIDRLPAIYEQVMAKYARKSKKQRSRCDPIGCMRKEEEVDYVQLFSELRSLVMSQVSVNNNSQHAIVTQPSSYPAATVHQSRELYHNNACGTVKTVELPRGVCAQQPEKYCESSLAGRGNQAGQGQWI